MAEYAEKGKNTRNTALDQNLQKQPLEVSY